MNLTNVESETLLLVRHEDLQKFAETLINSKPEPSKKQEPEIEQPMSFREAIKFLGKSRQTLTVWRNKGIITAHMLGGRVYFLRSELLAALTKSK